MIRGVTNTRKQQNTGTGIMHLVQRPPASDASSSGLR